MSDLHPKKAVCWLRFQMFVSGLLLYIHSGGDVSISPGEGMCLHSPPLHSNTDICLSRYSIALEDSLKAFLSINLDTDAQVPWTRWCCADKIQDFLFGRAVGLAAPGAA